MKGRRLDVQGLRAVAILMVVAFHADIGLTGGFTGVDVFFAVSGFVITGTLVRELERSDRIDLPAFYGRRVKRLLPGLAAMLTFVGLAGMMLAPVAAVHVSAVTGMAASVFAANFYLYSLPHGYFDVSSNLDPLLHTWTLAVEEQFYLVYPLVLLAAWRLGRRSARPSAARGVAILVVVAACAVSVLLAERWSTHAGALAFYASPARAWEFGAGCLVALLAPLWARTPQRVCFGLAAAGAAAIVVAATSAGDNGAVLRDLGLPVAGTCLLMAGGARPNRVTELLARRPFVAIGDLSYSWYLWHWPVIVFARAIAPGNSWAAAAGAVVSLAPAWASYHFLENPIRFKARIVGRRALVLAAVCIEVPLAAALVQLHVPLATASAGISVPGREPVRACSAELSSTQRPRCTWLAPQARGTVVLVGDSNAGHFAEPVVAAARRAHLNVTAAVQSGCPFLSLRFANGSLDYRPCMHANRVFLSWLLSTRPSLVIVGMRSDEMIADPAWGLAASNGTPIHTAVGKTRLMALGLRSEIVALSRVGVPVLVVHPVPEVTRVLSDTGSTVSDSTPARLVGRFAADTGATIGDSIAVFVGVDRGACAVLLLLNGRCFTSRSRALVDRALRRTLAAEQLALRGLRSGSLLDVENDLCTTTRCPSARNGVSLYADNFHPAWWEPARSRPRSTRRSQLEPPSSGRRVSELPCGCRDGAERALRVGLLWRAEWDPVDQGAPNIESCKLRDVFAAFATLGVNAEPVVYSDETDGAVGAQLLDLDGVLVWVNPIEHGRDRSKLDPLLRAVAAAGVWVSAHPDVILKMGTKEVLVDTQHMSWGAESNLYRSAAQLREDLPSRLAARGPLVLKRHRGMGGDGVWKVELADPASSSPDEQSRVLVQHAVKGSGREELLLREFVGRCEPYFAGTGLMVEQPYQSRLAEGMIRAYLTHEKVVGFTHQYPAD